MNIRQMLQLRKDEYNKHLGQLEQLQKDKAGNELTLEGTKEELTDLEHMREVLQKTGEKAREYAKIRLESTMTAALKHVFGDMYSAEIDLDISAGKATAEIYLVIDYGNDNIIRSTPENNAGGGVVDIMSIALRFAMMQLHNDPVINGPLVLDEPGKHVSADYSIKLAEFLKFISTQFNKQVIFSTHNDDLKYIADKSYNVDIANGVSIVTESKGDTNVKMSEPGLQTTKQRIPIVRAKN